MSQKKVDIYKQQKKNRQSIIKKEKRMLMIEKLIALVVCIIAVVWVGYSIRGKVVANQPVVVQETPINVDALNNYSIAVDEEEAAEEIETSSDEDTDGAEELVDQTEESDLEAEDAE